jgi:hypothetical protein
MTPSPEPAPIFLRVQTRVRDEKPRESYEKKKPKKWANFALVLDCETTTDIRQDLNFLWWRFCELKNDTYVCQREGVVYADNLDKDSVKLIRDSARGERADVEDGCPEDIQVESRTKFVDEEFWGALRAGAVIVCFNLPFDISRLAVAYREAEVKSTGWSLTPWLYQGQPDKLKPWIRIQPKDSRSAFVTLVGGDPEYRLAYRGRFLDLSVLGWALRNQHMTLDGFLDSFDLKGKMKHEPTGAVTRRELKYGRRDVEQTLALLNAMKREYDGFPLDLPPEQAMSAASITKAFLDEMEIKQPASKFHLSDDVLGKCMQAYYGGRSEIRIRHQEVPVVVCDATSEYPSVAVLFKLWSLLVADNVIVQDCTTEAQDTLNRADLETVLDLTTWPQLAFFASVLPAGDVLPVRTLYGDSGNTNIGLNPLTSKDPIWYAAPDLVGSKLLTGNTPAVVQAFRLVPQGTQTGMRSTSIGTRNIDPANDDFFRAIIEERKALPEKHPHYLLLKIIANALYGTFAELNKYEYGKNRNKQLDVFSGEHKFDQTTRVVERPGRWQFPPAAALITAGGRLILAILESMVRERDSAYLLTDTDSMLFVAAQNGGLVACPGGRSKMPDGTPAVNAMTWKQVEEICSKLNRLNPYDQTVVGQMLKVESCNYDRAGIQRQLYGLAVSAKRYVVYARAKSDLQIIKPSEHGLGIAYVPDKRKRYTPADCKDQKTSYPRWIVEAWERLLADHFRNLEDPESALVARELWFGDLPAIMRIRVTTPNVMRALRRHDPGAAKPYNFALSPILAHSVADCTLIAPFSKHPEEWLTQNYTEIHSGEVVKLLGDYRGKKLLPQRLSNILWRHYRHKEEKSLGPDGKRCYAHTSGLLLRRPIAAMTPFVFIGKEVERRAQEGEDISVIESGGPIKYQAGHTAKTRAADAVLLQKLMQFSLRQLKQSGLSRDTIIQARRGARLHPDSRARLAQAVEELSKVR